MKLNEAFNYTIGGNGIFHYLSSLNVPWETSATILDVNFHGNHSGQKMTSPVVDLMCEADEGALSESHKGTLANVIFAQYGENWNKLYETLSFEYNPIENYSMTESGTDITERSNEDKLSGTDAHSISGSNTGTVTDSGGTTNTGTQGVTSTQSSESKIAGFNSPTYVDDNTTTGSGNSTRTDNLASTNTNTRTDNLAHTESDSITYGKKIETEGTEETTHSFTRSGNIGVMSSQQMIEQERNLWFWNFLKHVFEDIDSVLCCDVYGDITITDSNSSGGSGGGGSAEIMNKLDEISGQITTQTTTLTGTINNARDNIKANDDANRTTITNAIDTQTTTLSGAINDARDNIKTNDNTNTNNIRSDITGVVTNNY